MDSSRRKVAVWVRSVNSEDGVVLVTALLMLVVLTLMGIAAMSVRNTETSITKNNEVYQRNFYSAEGVTLEGVAALEKLSDTVLTTPGSYPAWLRQENPGINLEFSNQWPSGLIDPRKSEDPLTVVKFTPAGYAPDGTSAGDRIWSAAIDLGAASGSSGTYGSGSGGMTKVERLFDVYGMYDVKPGAGKSYHGKAMLVVGYKKQVDTP